MHRGWQGRPGVDEAFDRFGQERDGPHKQLFLHGPLCCAPLPDAETWNPKRLGTSILTSQRHGWPGSRPLIHAHAKLSSCDMEKAGPSVYETAVHDRNLQ